MDNPTAFMTPRHHAVRNFVVMELPRNHGRPLSPSQISSALHLEIAAVIQLLDDLEKHLFFLVRDRAGNVSWAFPVLNRRPPPPLELNNGRTIFPGWGEKFIATPFVLG